MQIQLAQTNNSDHNVEYRLGEFNILCEPDESVQLVSACQSAHFFEMSKFYKEVERVLVVDGVLAICGYSLPIPFTNEITMENIIQEAFHTMNPYVSNQRNHVYIDRYCSDDFQSFPFYNLEILREEFDKIENKATVIDLIGYVKSWSAYKNFQQIKGEKYANNVINDFQQKILTALHKEDENPETVEISIKFPYILLLGRKS